MEPGYLNQRKSKMSKIQTEDCKKAIVEWVAQNPGFVTSQFDFEEDDNNTLFGKNGRNYHSLRNQRSRKRTGNE